MEPLFWISGLLALAALADRLGRRSARRGAARVVADAEALFAGRHEYASVDPARYPWLDLGYYDRTRARLEGEGFRQLGDVEDLTLTRQNPGMHTFVRVMSGDSGRITAGIYQVRLRGPMAVFQWVGIVPRRIRVVELESELSDGRFLVTANTRGLDSTPMPAAVEGERLPLATPLEQQLARHRRRLEATLAASPGLEVRRVGSLNEALAAQHRQQELKNQVMGDREALVETIAGQPGLRDAKRWLIDEVRRADLAGPRAR